MTSEDDSKILASTLTPYTQRNTNSDPRVRPWSALRRLEQRGIPPGLTMHVPIAARTTDTPSKPKGLEEGSTNPAIIGVAVAVAFVFVFIAVYVYIAKRRPPNYSTAPKKSRWKSWTSRASPVGRFLHLRSTANSINSHDMEETSYAHSTRTRESHDTTNASANEASAADGVNRNTSIRSIMTLPPYHPTPRPHERLIAREGERAGVDTVIEFPETAEEEEERREEEMESLFQIRQLRRAEIAERNERRRERQEARAAGDWARLEQLRLQSQMRARARAGSSGSAASSTSNLPTAGQGINAHALLADHHARTASHERRVSSVSYAELGLARHDGTRIRADSMESDHRPLLESAASMGGDHRSPLHHNRAASAESVRTADSDLDSVRITPQTSSNGRSGSDGNARTPSSGNSNGEPSPPVDEPPQYEPEPYQDEEAPPYTSPVAERAEGPSRLPSARVPPYTNPVTNRGDAIPRLPSLRVDSSLPSIEIISSTPSATPAATPVAERAEERETAP